MKYFLLLVCFSATALAADWAQFRGPTGLNYTEEKNLPLKWDGKTGENIRWKAPLPKTDNAYSSPIVVGNRVIVTCAQNEPLTQRVLCFAKADGKPMWETVIPPGPLLLKDLRGGYGAPTPCSDGQHIYVLFGSAVLAKLDLDGKSVWQKPLPKIDFDVALGTSPILYKDTVIVDCDQTKKSSSIIAFDKATGEIRWEVKRPETDFAHSTPVVVQVAGQPQMLVSATKALQSLDPATGKIIWWCAASGDSASAAYDGKVVYCDSGRGGKGVCVDPTGMGDVTATHLKWTYPQIPEGLSSPIIAQGLVWRAHGPEIVKAFHVEDGKLAFSERLKGVSSYASPIATPDGRIYFASAGHSYVVKATDGKLEVLADSDLGEESRGSAAVSDGCLFVRGNKNLYCIGSK